MLSRLGRDVALGGRGGTTLEPPVVFSSINDPSSKRVLLLHGSTPPFSASFVNNNLRDTIYPDGVTTGSVVGDSPLNAHVKDWVAFDWAMTNFLGVWGSGNGGRCTFQGRKKVELIFHHHDKLI